MKKVVAALPAAALVLAALPLAYIGLFLIAYSGDSATPSDTWVNVAGREIDADIVGIGAVAAAMLLLATAFAFARRLRRVSRPPGRTGARARRDLAGRIRD